MDFAGTGFGGTEVWSRPAFQVGSKKCPALRELGSHEREKGMSNAYATVSALIFALVAIAHLLRIVQQWSVRVESVQVPMSVSWVGLIIAALIAVWGLYQ